MVIELKIYTEKEMNLTIQNAKFWFWVGSIGSFIIGFLMGILI